MNTGLYPISQAHLFVSPLFTLAIGQFANVPHGLGGKPQFVRWVLENVVADEGYVPGDEIEFYGVLDVSAGVVRLTGDANATHVFAVSYSLLVGLGVHNKTSGAFNAITSTRWRAKCYAYFFGP